MIVCRNHKRTKMVGFQQRPWTPTKRRGPIAAEFSGPGPACVSLGTYIIKNLICIRKRRVMTKMCKWETSSHKKVYEYSTEKFVATSHNYILPFKLLVIVSFRNFFNLRLSIIIFFITRLNCFNLLTFLQMGW